jgi:F-type H+-transporting ATPase subunit epsilon
MAEKLHFSLVSPARELFSGEVDHVIAPGSEGEFGVLPRHAPYMATLRPGVVRVLRDGQPDMRLYVEGGFADVTPSGLTILAEEAVDLADLDAGVLDADIQKAREAIASHGRDQNDPEAQRLQGRLASLEHRRAALG